MAEALDKQRQKLRKMELQFNIMKLETRTLELDEEKMKIQEAIEKQILELKSLEELR